MNLTRLLKNDTGWYRNWPDVSSLRQPQSEGESG